MWAGGGGGVVAGLVDTPETLRTWVDTGYQLWVDVVDHGAQGPFSWPEDGSSYHCPSHSPSVSKLMLTYKLPL